MTGKEMLRGAITLIITIIGFSCDHSNPEANNQTSEHLNIEPKKNVDSKILSTYHEDWLEMRHESNKLVFKQYYLHPDSNIVRNLNSVDWTDSTFQQKKIAEFNGLFNDVPDQGYCCCPFSFYSVTFYKDTRELGVYFVDTSMTTNKATFFDPDYQTSYLIDLEAWKSFIQDF